MRDSVKLAPLALVVTTAVFFCTLIVVSPDSVLAGDPLAASDRPYIAAPRHDLDAADERATLEAVRLALTEVGDGATYVWHRANGRLSGTIQPTASFRDGRGQICRHLVINLSSATLSRRAEGIACRQADGSWQLAG